ncbi:MAG: hypothetical protein KKH72_04040 [Alphaproteobacteria bacterium]|nr:hypothetical protein [Alphaproteobacteria bacterium]
MATPTEDKAIPLDDVMLAMDVVDTLRHRQDLVMRELSEADRETYLLGRLRDIYSQQGIAVSDQILKEGVAALKESRFLYEPPGPSLGTTLAKAYVSRKSWGPWVAGICLVVALGVGGYAFGYLPYQAAQVEAARIELAEALPKRMDELVATVGSESKVPQAVGEAQTLRDRGKSAAALGNRAEAVAAVTALEKLIDRLRLDYTVRVINRDGERSGFWTFPEINVDATNFYLVVEAVDSTTGAVLSLDIPNEETGASETVSVWGLRVPEQTYRMIETDKGDDGIIQKDVVGVKQYGFLDPDYTVAVLGGTLTRW